MEPSIFLFLATFTAIAKSAALSKRQSVATCYGDKGPNLNDCDSLIALLGWTGTPTSKIEPDPSGGLTFYHDHHALNCEIGIAWNNPNNRLSIITSSLLPYINIIKDKCIVRSEAGGESDSVDDNWTVRVTNDPRYNPLTKHRRQAEGDTYSLEVLSRAIERPGFRQKVGPSLPSASSYTVTKGEANTISVGASFEISGGFFKVFVAGVSASFESSHTVENSQSTQINVDCIVAASPCKPLTSAVTTLPESSLTSSATEIVESTTTEISTVVETSVTETLPSTITDTTSSDTIIATLTTASADTTTLFTVDTSATETFTSSVVDTTSNELVSTTVITSSADTTTLFTTETTEQTTTPTLSETTTAEKTTATEAAGPTDFFIIAGPGQALGEKLESTTSPGSVVAFNIQLSRGGAFGPRRFVVDDTTGMLYNEGTPMCAVFDYLDKKRAKTSLCNNESRAYGISYIVCDQSPAPGDVLHCTAAKLDCWQTGPSSQRCQEAESDPLWNNQFFIEHITAGELAGESRLFFGVDNLADTYQTSYSTLEKVDLFVDFVGISAE
ncbi:uncharacterized protein FIESC28_00852 [Fusarium coffeatum]|uniref:C2 domain-containing protein n=1 Tax=Fusarium coffeatum TaxID=231269 RepID=A0A366SBL7_9HYPO|nr:uncharacterized protein FIESC28_00852 [Fusarium coffeatum]RBR26352.1 hypothetical protein FIESC28_00852 [Fusarium coffeatum]